MNLVFKNGYLLLGIVLIAAGLIFLHHLNQPGFFHDGYLYAALGKNAAELNEWLVPSVSKAAHTRFHDHIPFVFILEGAFFKVFGSGFWQARLFVNIFSLLIVYEIFKKLRKYRYYEQSLVAIFFFLISLPFLKQARYPNLDIPLTYFILMALFKYFDIVAEKKKSDWLLVGFWWGLALLTKGPIAFVVPIVILVHLVSSKKIFKELKLKEPWIGLFVGLVVFFIWPFLLWLTNNLDVFHGYIQHTFFNTIKDSRGTLKNDYLLYVRHLATFVPLNLILTFFAVFKYFKLKIKDEFFELNLILVFVVLILMSMMKFKYSHYIIPIYPFLAILSAFGLTQILKIDWNKYLAIFLILGGVAINIVPPSESSFRDRDLFDLQKVLVEKNLQQLDWIVVQGTYPYWAAHNFHAYINHKSVYEESGLQDKPKMIYIIGNSSWDSLAEKKGKYIFLYKFQKTDSVAVVKNEEI